MSLVASFCKGVNKHRLEKDSMLCLWSRRRMCGGLEVQVNGSLSENPQRITQPRGPQTAKHHLFFQTRRTQHVQTVQRLRQRLPTTVHTTNGLLGIVIKKKRARNCARPHRLIRRRRPIVGHCVLTTAEIGEVLCNPPDRAKPAHRRRIKLNRWPVL